MRKILIEFEFNPPNKVTVKRGGLLRNGVEILIRYKNILITNNNGVLSDLRYHNIQSCIVLGSYSESLPSPKAIVIGDIPRYLGDRREAIKFEQECMAHL